MIICRTLPQRIGDNIYFYRKERGLSQFKLAEAADLSQTYIGRLEHGKINATVETLEKVADALGVKVAELFDRNLYLKRAKDDDLDKIVKLYLDQLKYLYSDARVNIFSTIDLLCEWQRYVPKKKKR